jgi:hypothetical protein
VLPRYVEKVLSNGNRWNVLHEKQNCNTVLRLIVQELSRPAESRPRVLNRA